MREIKFRVWDKRHKEMCSVTDIQLWCNHVHYSQDDSGIGKGNYPDDVEIMQYTGLTDRNDKEIYEGDILRDVDTGQVVQIVYNAPSFVLVDDRHFFYLSFCADAKEIIGNIYEEGER